MRDTDHIPDLLERLSRILQNEAHAGDLKPTQWEALRYLARANQFSRNPSAVTAYLGMTKGTVSQTLNAMERKGLIRKKTDPTNRRNVHLELTKAASFVLERDPINALSEMTQDLPVRERDAIAVALKSILRTTLRRRGRRPFGACKSCRFFEASGPEGLPHRCGLLCVPLSVEDSELLCVEHEFPTEPSGALAN